MRNLSSISRISTQLFDYPSEKWRAVENLKSNGLVPQDTVPIEMCLAWGIEPEDLEVTERMGSWSDEATTTSFAMVDANELLSEC